MATTSRATRITHRREPRRHDAGRQRLSGRQTMSENNRIVWSEGLFLRPQHFQQQERYLESWVEGRTGALRPYVVGLHRARDRARPARHRQARPATRARRVSRRHAVRDAGRRSAAGAARDRPAAARSGRFTRRAAAQVRRDAHAQRQRRRHHALYAAAITSRATSPRIHRVRRARSGRTQRAPDGRRASLARTSRAFRSRTSSSAARTSGWCSTMRSSPRCSM